MVLWCIAMGGNYIEMDPSSIGDLGLVDVDLVGLEVFLGPSNVRIALERSTRPGLRGMD